MKQNRILGLALIIVLVAAALTWAGARSSAWLGVYTQEVDPDLAEAFDLKVDRGAIINEVVEDSPAEEAGLQEDDIIVSVDGDRVRDDDDLIDMVSDRDPGDDIKLTIFRDGKETEIEATLGRRPRSRQWSNSLDFFRSPRSPRAPRAPHAPHVYHSPKAPRVYSYTYDNDDFIFGGEHPYIGVTMINISSRTAKSLGADGHGVLIDDVEGDSPARDAGLEPGDLIVVIDGEKVYETSDVQDIIGDLDEGDVAKVEIVRARERKSVEVTVELDEDDTYFGGSHILRLRDLADIDLDFPRTSWLSHTYSHDNDNDNDLFDSDDFRDAMEEFEDEMKDLKIELRELQKALE